MRAPTAGENDVLPVECRIAERRAAESGMGHSVMDSADELRKEWQLNGRPAGVQGAATRDQFEEWARREGHSNLMRMAGDPDQYDDLILRANYKGWLAAPVPALAAPGEASEADKLQRLTVQGMADCMDMVRTDLIGMGIIDKTVAPMFIPEAIAKYIKAQAASSERAPEPSAASVGDDAEFKRLVDARFVADTLPKIISTDRALVQYIDNRTACAAGAQAEYETTELSQEVARLQNALCFWLPSVTDREDECALRILEDAFLLVGCDGNMPADFKSAQELGWIVFAADVARTGAVGLTDEQKDVARYALSATLGDAMDCTRVWSAWGVGTMSEGDFQLLADNDERLDELVEALSMALAAQVSGQKESA
jgi:hypothetical protein